MYVRGSLSRLHYLFPPEIRSPARQVLHHAPLVRRHDHILSLHDGILGGEWYSMGHPTLVNDDSDINIVQDISSVDFVNVLLSMLH